MLLFCLEDLATGEIKNLAAPEGTTETQARARYGGIWLDATRTLCSPPCRIGRARQAAVAPPAPPVSLGAARQQAAKARRLATRCSGRRVA